MTPPPAKLLSPALLGLLAALPATAQEARSEEEEFARNFSFRLGAKQLDEKALEWSEVRECVACHTNGLALIAQPVVSRSSRAVADVRRFAGDYLDGYLAEGNAPDGQHGSLTGLVATTAFLAMSDSRRGRRLEPETRRGLDHAWSVLDESGTWEGWLQCNWPPFEADTEFAPALMLVALGELRDAFGEEALTDADRTGAASLQAWLSSHPPAGLHDRAMRVWAGAAWAGVAPAEQLSTWREELASAQGEDGGWSMGALAAPTWKHDGGQPQSVKSGAYATGFSLYVLQQTGADRKAEGIERGLEWLRDNQRASGLWFESSPRRDRKHYISHAATAFALLALADPPRGTRSKKGR